MRPVWQSREMAAKSNPIDGQIAQCGNAPDAGRFAASAVGIFAS